jgi:spoIIIJ-associated protein
VDDRPGDRDSQAHAETGHSTEAYEPHSAEGAGGRRGARGRECGQVCLEPVSLWAPAPREAEARRPAEAMTRSAQVRVEASGETVGEAKWAALRELEQLVPGLDRDSVRFQVVSEGERGLLGVGFTPARVVAEVEGELAAVQTEAAEAAREFVQRVADAIGAQVSATAAEREGTVTVTCSGDDLGLLIGKHGQTLDAIQYLANAVARAEGSEHGVVVDAGGYRARRSASLEALARQSARRASATGNRVELEPMTAVERKIVHELLKDDPEVQTMSEGMEPNRYVVVIPRLSAD